MFMIDKVQSDHIIETPILKYVINDKTKTASICGFNTNCKNLFIQRSVKHKSIDYPIVCILEFALSRMNVETIQFASDSELTTIEMGAFKSSEIKSLSLPSSVIHLEDGWCNGTEKLNDINIDPQNPRYKIYEGKSIIGKSSIYQDNYDVFVFSERNIEELTIPNYIEIIGKSAFEDCIQIDRIEIPIDSKLKTIDCDAFTGSFIKAISIPSHLTQICENAFSFCEKLKKVEIPIDSELKKIDAGAFSMSKIESIFIPSQIEVINKNVFHKCKNLRQIEFAQNSKLKIIKRKAFFKTSLTSITIPQNLKIIGDSAFSRCMKLTRIEIPENSTLQMILKFAFSDTPLESILIPASLTHLNDGWCAKLANLTDVKIMPSNPRYIYLEGKYIVGKSKPDIDEFDVLVFARRDIETAIIPSFIKRIAPYAFDSCLKLESIEFLNDSKLQIIGHFAFQNSMIKSITIPPHVTRINEGAFQYCERLKTVEIPENSELNTIESNAFKNSSIESLLIPSNLINLDDKWCLDMKNLININVMDDNPLYSKYNDDFVIAKSSIDQQFYDVLVFARRNIKKAVIPDFITVIGPNAFNSCNHLRVVQMSENSLLQSIEEGAFRNLSIKNIQFPPQLLKIGADCFYNCNKLRKFRFPENSKLQLIEDNAFLNSSITGINLPKDLKHIGKRAFFDCGKFKRLVIPVDSKLQTIDDSAFYFTKIRSVFIPQYLKESDIMSFYMCHRLRIMEIDQNVEISIEFFEKSYSGFSKLRIMIPVKSKFE